MTTLVERLSALDAAFLELENDTQHLHVGSLLLFDAPAPSFAQFCEHVESRLAGIPRYRQRVQRMPFDLARPVWVDDPRFRLADHLRHTAVPSPGTPEQLRELFGRVLSHRLDPSRPLWELWLVEGLPDGGWAVVTKTHHAMVDGLAGSEVMELLLDGEPDAGEVSGGEPSGGEPSGGEPARVPWRPRPQPSRRELAVAGVTGLVRLPLEAAVAVVAAARDLAAPAALARSFAVRVNGLATLGRSAASPTSALNGPLAPHRRWGWARADLAQVKAVRAAVGCSVNDVVLAAVTGGLREFLLSRGEPVDDVTIRSLVPVSVRTAEHRGHLGNRVTAMFAELPVGVADPVDRLAEVTREMNRLKASGEAAGVATAVSAADLVPATLMSLGLHVYAATGQRVVNVVTTNVPGPARPLHLLGRRLLELFPYIPVAESVRLSIGVVSYDGHLAVGVTGDYDAVPDLDVLCAAIERSFAELTDTFAAAPSRRG